LPPPHVATIMLTCKRCGYLAIHSLKALGIIP
jgi:hypothetical protein